MSIATKLMKLFRNDSYTALNSIRFTRLGELTGSQRRTPTIIYSGGKKVSPEATMSSVHWILRWKHQLDLRQKMFVLETLILRMTLSGRTFGDYLLLADLVFLSREDSRDFHQQRLITFAEILLDENLDWDLRVRTIENLYSSYGTDPRRVYGNLKKRWKPEDHLSIVDIPLETYIDLAPKGEPYSSYCKGYGEGSSRGLKLTPKSAELDGDEIDSVREIDVQILELCSYLRTNLIAQRRRKQWEGSKQ